MTNAFILGGRIKFCTLLSAFAHSENDDLYMNSNNT